MESVAQALKYIVAAAAVAAFIYFGVVPWIKPLYLRYREWVQKTASGDKG